MEQLQVFTDAKHCTIPGLDLHKNFVTEEEEKVGEKCTHAMLYHVLSMPAFSRVPESIFDGKQKLLAEVEEGCWETLARRRVQHFGYKFEYWVRCCGQHERTDGSLLMQSTGRLRQHTHAKTDMRRHRCGLLCRHAMWTSTGRSGRCHPQHNNCFKGWSSCWECNLTSSQSMNISQEWGCLRTLTPTRPSQVREILKSSILSCYKANSIYSELSRTCRVPASLFQEVCATPLHSGVCFDP